MRVAPNGTRTFFVRIGRKLRTENVTLGTVDDLTAAEARAEALAEIGAARVERETGPLMADFAEDFMRRLARRWKPATQESNRHFNRERGEKPCGVGSQRD